jgi:hypothetical protein
VRRGDVREDCGVHVGEDIFVVGVKVRERERGGGRSERRFRKGREARGR